MSKLAEVERALAEYVPDAAAKVTNPKDRVGATKSPIGLVPFGAVVQVAPVFKHGADKYSPFNWRQERIGHMTYVSAALRHLFAYIDGETVDPDSGLPHVAHAIGGLMILLDAVSIGMAVDDRPTPGQAGALISSQTRKPEAH